LETQGGQDQKIRIREEIGSVTEDKVSKAPALAPNIPDKYVNKTYLYHANQQFKVLQEQADLLIKQAKEIEERVKLAELIYSQNLNFKPVLLKHYYLYEKGLSLIGPSEWNYEHLGEFLFTVKQLGDGTWQKI
tara:strand:+ start:157 stop:555 length:399 start_codon:yes stop_codon:yes gene_type:complete